MMGTAPLPLYLPDELSDQAAAELVQCLYEFTHYVETRYFEQIERHYEREAAEAPDPRQQRLFEDEDLDEPLFDELL